MKIHKLLVANRGEIAVRIFQTCQELNVRTVAVFSDADENALHRDFADEALHIGGSDPSQSYLSIQKILEAAQRSGADAIHPGYGFLSERSEFAKACEELGICFVGPSSQSMALLGDKISSKKLARTANVPIVPGYAEPDGTLEQILAAADSVGYPVMLKAAAGGGGRGMRVAVDADSLRSQLPLAIHEAVNSFGNGQMMVEKLILNPRHVEVQVAADQLGNVACLFERECSLQRRNQKMLEEAPAPAVQLGLVEWHDLRQAAIDMVRAAGYTNLGTVEFIVDPEAGRFYFLEVNTRLQVEHPVTEACTALDLVALQLRIAEGRSLDLPPALMAGDRTAISGHSIEARVLAEQPREAFRPSTGLIKHWSIPSFPGLRIDTGFTRGSEVSPFYDSLLAKVIVHAESRLAAIQKLTFALEQFHVLGIDTNIAFLLHVLNDPRVKAAELNTGLLQNILDTWHEDPVPGELGALITHADQAITAHPQTTRNSPTPAWSQTDQFRLTP